MTDTLDALDHLAGSGSAATIDRAVPEVGATPAGVTDDAAFTKILGRLSKLSVERHFDAYVDVPWDDPDLQVDVADPRWAMFSADPLADTEWFRAQPPAKQSEIGLYRMASVMKTGWHFENLLQRGLLQYAFSLPNHAPEFRYLHHEVIEESQHTLMFQELVNRSGLPVKGLPRAIRALATMFVVPLVRVNPALFFWFVLGGEDPVDHLQKLQIASGTGHPLTNRIYRIHVTEEARHLSFARHFLRRSVPQLPRARRFALSLVLPVLFAVMTRMMLCVAPDLVRHCGVPKDVNRAAWRSPAGRRLLREAVAKPRQLAGELGLLNPVAIRVWKLGRVWDEPVAAPARRATRPAA